MAGIEKLLAIGGWLKDDDADGLPDGLDVIITVGSRHAPQTYAALGQLALRLGYEVAALGEPVCLSEQQELPQARHRVVVGRCNRHWPEGGDIPEPPTGSALAWLQGPDLLLTGDDASLSQLISYLAAIYPQVSLQDAAPCLQDVGEGLAAHLGSEASCVALVYDSEVLTSLWRLAETPSTHRAAADLERLADLPAARIELRGKLLAMEHEIQLPYPSPEALSEDRVQLACLGDLFSIGGLLLDRNGDFLPDAMAGNPWPEVTNNREAVAVINLMSRFGLETTGLRFPLEDNGQPLLQFVAEEGAKPTVALEENTLLIRGEPGARGQVLDYLAFDFPSSPLGVSWTELALRLEGWAREPEAEEEPWQELVLPWEVDELFSRCERLLTEVQGELTLEVRVSEPLEVRESIKQRLLSASKVANVIVRCAYKQGLHWIREEVIPALEGMPIASCLIEFAPFVCENALDPRARWLLELYPVDDLLARQVGVGADQVQFRENPDLSCTYRLIACDAQGEICYSSDFTVWHSQRRYIDLLPESPLVHPPTGGIKWQAGGEYGYIHLATDAEQVWEIYQKAILPLASSQAEEQSFQQENQPFFERLDIQVEFSEPEERLDLREERVSVADALHEDLYFVGLDCLKRLGERNGERLRSPGLILPDVKATQGKAPRLRYRLLKKRCEYAGKLPRWQSFSFGEHGIEEAVADWHLESAGEVARVAALLRAKDVEKEHAEGLRLRVNLLAPACNQVVEFFLTQASLNAAAEEPLAEGIIYPDDCLARLAPLAGRAGVMVSLAGVSRQGRPIYAVAVTSSAGGRRRAAAKFAAWKPTYMLNNRHHANEVSSTSAAIELLDALSRQEEMTALLQKLNVVAIPLENVDGAALHARLVQGNPEHKLHAARFNSLGQEFAEDYFKTNGAVAEARVLPSLWRTWVPDVIADNHGIPSHEWEQPFSGYLCPWFASFWIPRSLFYGYFWYVDDVASPSLQLARDLEKAIRSSLIQDGFVAERNGELLAKWRKYFIPYLTDHFAGEERDDMLWYYIPYKTNPHSRFASHRYPHLTILDWTSEVADETAQGEYLRHCIRTHRLSQEACLRFMADLRVAVQESFEVYSNGLTRERVRQRPLTIE